MLSRAGAIPVVDIFAGPGGLGEGFASANAAPGSPAFRLTLSIEKDYWAHQTLELRAFHRQFETPPDAYFAHIRGAIDRQDLYARHPLEAAAAAAEAVRLILSPEASGSVRDLVAGRISADDPWVLIGGPPCQAYSLIGRARNRGISHYVPEADHRQTLYLEYLQILADHAPPVFIMENVKGLLSARLAGQHLFSRISADLREPAQALARESRGAVRSPRYQLRSLAAPNGMLPAGESPTDFLVRAERHGVPQARHRVIIMGVREDIASRAVHLLPEAPGMTVGQELRGLPRLRSGLSGEPDTPDAWLRTLSAAPGRKWFKQLDSRVSSQLRESLESLVAPKAGRGSNFRETAGGLVLNHESRSHIAPDLDRYLFASVFARVEGRSPELARFPKALRPLHRNVDRALAGGHFADRFRVQIAERPATTVTSHISKDGHYYIHYDATQCRSLTVREAARLQTFPDDYFFAGPRTAQYLQVGNAVPPLLARQIAGLVRELLIG